ncbi:TIGR02391 family protein [Nocardia sp. NPDC059180]|uniref:TIGR02391 family protein n=1 Tax=Nocardia sp. NPDC059180 TaxID=3346761 RepID=UPI0036C6D06D
MRTEFKPEGGPLTDPAAEGGEKTAMMDLFAGAIGAFKNPANHRTNQFDDAVEAAGLIQLADLLLKVVRRPQGGSRRRCLCGEFRRGDVVTW